MLLKVDWYLTMALRSMTWSFCTLKKKKKSREITHAPPKPQNWAYSKLEKKMQNMSRSICDCFSQRSQVDRQHNHLRWKAALKDTVAGNLTHVTSGQLVHLCSDAVLLHQWFLREADMQHVTNCSHYPVSYDYVNCNMLQTVHITMSVMILSVHITLPLMIL